MLLTARGRDRKCKRISQEGCEEEVVLSVDENGAQEPAQPSGQPVRLARLPDPRQDHQSLTSAAGLLGGQAGGGRRGKPVPEGVLSPVLLDGVVLDGFPLLDIFPLLWKQLSSLSLSFFFKQQQQKIFSSYTRILLPDLECILDSWPMNLELLLFLLLLSSSSSLIYHFFIR